MAVKRVKVNIRRVNRQGGAGQVKVSGAEVK